MLPSACDAYDKATTLFGVSKSLSLPGLRIGWLVTRDVDVMNRLKSFKDYLSICSSAPSEILSLIALRLVGLLREGGRRGKDLELRTGREEIRYPLRGPC